MLVCDISVAHTTFHNLHDGVDLSWTCSSFQKGKDLKIIHLKSQTSAALPIYTSDLSHLSLLEAARQAASHKVCLYRGPNPQAWWIALHFCLNCFCGFQKGAGKSKKTEKAVKRKDTAAVQQESSGEGEEMPQLVPIGSPNKKAKLEVRQSENCNVRILF